MNLHNRIESDIATLVCVHTIELRIYTIELKVVVVSGAGLVVCFWNLHNRIERRFTTSVRPPL